VLEGECVLIVEGHERTLGRWDFAHFPPMTEHIVVGAGSGPCILLRVGARRPGRPIRYPVNEVARRHAAGVERETDVPREAYAPFAPGSLGPYREGDLP
jgi:uncharacterized cupin superfamily protein